MEASSHDFNLHISDCNKDFRENIMKKIHVIKLKDTSLLNKKVSYQFEKYHHFFITQVEELKQQEGWELSQLNKAYVDLD